MDPKLADKNQQDILPHVRLMEWVWSYFVDSSSDSDAHHDVGHKPSTRAGAVHAQPSKQDSGSSHWQGQEDDKSRKQQRTGDEQTAPLASGCSQNGAIISRTGRPFVSLAEALQETDAAGGFAGVGCSNASVARECCQSSCHRLCGTDKFDCVFGIHPFK